MTTPNDEIVMMVDSMGMGFTQNAIKRAVVATKNAGADAAIDWLYGGHMEDADINDPLPPTAAAASESSSSSSIVNKPVVVQSQSDPLVDPAQCSHMQWLRQPPKNPIIHKEECTQCFHNDQSVGGINVCLSCFNGGCTGVDSMQHSLRHAALCHSLVLNIQRKEIVRPERDEPMIDSTLTAEQNMAAVKKRLEEEAAEPTHFYETQVRCLECKLALDQTRHAPLAQCVEAVLASQTIAQAAGVAMFTEEVKTDCPHCTDSAKQVDNPPQLGDRTLTTCSSCDVKDAMWLCLTCGALGCSRRQMVSVGVYSKGNGHAAAHAASTGHAVVVKIGTITAEGRGDCYCYKCDSAVENKNLVKQLSTFNIIIDANTQATSQSTAELALALNVNANFNMAHDADGKEADLAFGPGKTGLANLGNSCYMASVLQVLFALPSFQQKYYSTALQHLSTCTSQKPSECFMCQMSKLAIGLLSGRYDPQPPPEVMARIKAEREARLERSKLPRGTDTEEAKKDAELKKMETKAIQNGVAPRGFKMLTSAKHPEFSSSRQQDSFEYIHYLLDYIKKREHADAAKFDPYQPFQFYQEERLECVKCHRVKYSQLKTTEISLPIPLPEPLPPKDEPMTEAPAAPAAAAAAAATTDASSTSSSSSSSAKPSAPKKPAKEYPPVAFEACLKEWAQPTISEEWQCPQCRAMSSAKKSSRLTTFPAVMMVHLRRFVYEGWVPEKLDIDIDFGETNGRIKFDSLRAAGVQAGEVLLPEDPAGGSSSSSAAPTPNAAIVAQIEAMGMGMTRNAISRAVLATGNSSADAAVTWLFSGHSEDPDINDPLPSGSASSGSTSKPAAVEPPTEMVMNLSQMMGFEPARCKYALQQCSLDQERAVEWLFSNSDKPIPMEDVPAAAAGASSSSGSAPEEVSIDTTPAGYELFAFVTHMGKSTGSGHYVAHVLKEGQWMLYNDQKVSYCTEPMRAARHAYIYFFRRI